MTDEIIKIMKKHDYYIDNHNRGIIDIDYSKVADEIDKAHKKKTREEMIKFINWKNEKDQNWLKFIDIKEVDEYLQKNKK